MIPGDIDLTEKLDFRKVVKHEISKLPWKNKKPLFTKYSNFINDINDINSTYSYNTYYNTCNYSNNITYTTTNNTNFYYSNSNIITYMQDNNTNIIMYNTSKCYDNDSIPWKCNKHNYIESAIPWENNVEKQIRKISWYNATKYLKYINIMIGDDNNLTKKVKIPWDMESKNENFNLSSIKYRAKNLIDWLHNKTPSFIERYLNNESNLSYLTNMQWIQIHDAIID